MQKKLFFLALIIFLGINDFAFAAKPMQMPPTVVTLAKAEQINWQDSLVVIGSLSASDGTMLSPEVAGRVTKIFFESGQYAKKGAPLVQLYPDILMAQLEKSKAQYAKSTADYTRNSTLYKKGYVDKSTLDRYKATMDSDKADIDMYQSQLRQLLIQAPFSGSLGLRRISVGDYIKPGDTIVSLQAFDPIRVDFSIPQVYLPSVKIGDTIIINAKAFGRMITGTIYAFDSAVNTNTRSIDVRANVPNPEHLLTPGTYVEVKVLMKTSKPVIVVPQTAIVYSTSGNYVYRMLEHKAVKTVITLGDKLPSNQVVITKGIQPGETIITEGQLKLFDGAPVMTQAEFQQMAAQMMQKNMHK